MQWKLIKLKKEANEKDKPVLQMNKLQISQERVKGTKIWGISNENEIKKWKESQKKWEDQQSSDVIRVLEKEKHGTELMFKL